MDGSNLASPDLDSSERTRKVAGITAGGFAKEFSSVAEANIAPGVVDDAIVSGGSLKATSSGAWDNETRQAMKNAATE